MSEYQKSFESAIITTLFRPTIINSPWKAPAGSKTFNFPTCVIRQFTLKRFRYAILQQKNEFVNFNGPIKSFIF